MLAQFVVGLALRLAEFAEEGLLRFLRQIGEHLRLGASQQEGAHRSGHHLGCAPSPTAGEKSLETRGTAELTRIEKFENAPELADVILNRGSGQGQTVAGPEQSAGFGRLAAGIFDRLRLVENDVIEFDLPMLENVAA